MKDIKKETKNGITRVVFPQQRVVYETIAQAEFRIACKRIAFLSGKSFSKPSKEN